MDYAGLPTSMEELFRTYDGIVARGRYVTDEPEAQETPTAFSEPVADEPVWEEPKMAPKPLGQSWRDLEAARQEAAERRMNEHLKNPNGATFKQDEEGLNKAYANETATGVYYDPDTRTEYVKGSVTGRDFYDDVTKIPVWGDVHKAERYQQADKAYKDLITHGKPVDRIVGHSLGGSVALQMQRDKFIPKSRTFGAPVLDLMPFHRYYNDAERYRHPLDPVSILDRGAKWGGFKPYSHSYTGFQTY